VCVVVLPIGLSCPVKFVVCHRGDRDTRWAFCCSRGCGCGDVKMADVRVPPASRGEPRGARLLGSPCLQGEPKEGVIGHTRFCELWLRDWYKGTSLEFTVCGVRTLFRPHPQPLSHSVGEGRRAQCFWSAEAPASAWAEASLPHSIIPPRPPCGRGGQS